MTDAIPKPISLLDRLPDGVVVGWFIDNNFYALGLSTNRSQLNLVLAWLGQDGPAV